VAALAARELTGVSPFGQPATSIRERAVRRTRAKRFTARVSNANECRPTTDYRAPQARDGKEEAFSVAFARERV